jgi:hypothetical protein
MVKPRRADPDLRELVRRLRFGTPQPDLTGEIARARCPPEARAGMYLINGDWERAHETAQAQEGPTAAYWHALVHRHEPDYGNSKYWLRRAGQSPIHARLLETAARESKLDLVAPDGQWDPIRFTDCYADPAHHDWTRRIEAAELEALLEHSLTL